MTRPLSALLFAATALAALPPYDFTGHWTGNLFVPGFFIRFTGGDFTSTSPKTFTGSLTAVSSNGTVTCDVHGKRKRKVQGAGGGGARNRTGRDRLSCVSRDHRRGRRPQGVSSTRAH